MIQFKIAKDVHNRLVVLNVITNEVNNKKEPLRSLIIDFLGGTDADDLINIISTKTAPHIITVIWKEEWNYEHTECDSYFQEILSKKDTHEHK